MQGREHSRGMSKSKTGLQSLGQGSWKRYGSGRVGQGRVCGVLKTELRFVDGGNTWWEILEQVRVVEKCGSEFRCSVTWSVTVSPF